MRSTILALLSIAVLVPCAEARDIFVVRFSRVVAIDPCNPLRWGDRLLLYNRTRSSTTVRILGISDGTPNATIPDSVVLDPGIVVDLDSKLGGAWRPVPFTATAWLFVMHLDVPDGVTIDSTDTFYSSRACLGPPLSFPASFGHASMPVYDHLTPAGVPQVHLSTDLGIREIRTNVIVHNAGTLPGSATIELRRECDGSITDQRIVTVPPNTTIQVGGLVRGTPGSCGSAGRYVLVTVDQPSLSVVSALTVNPADAATGFTPTVDLTVAHSHDL